MPNPIVALSTSLEYGQLRAAVALGELEVVAERYLPDGTLMAAFEERTGRRNAKISISARFFAGALKDYENWQEKWWREAIQNAVDANATKVTCEVRETQEGFLVSVHDNGRGMDYDTIVNKFLALGGSGKEGPSGTHGGFGKAKEMLILPWLTWQIESSGVKITGAGIEYEESQSDIHKGVKLTVLMPKDNTTSIAFAKNYLKKCWIPRVQFSCVSDNDVENVVADMSSGDHIRNLVGAELYVNKHSNMVKTNTMFVRTHAPNGDSLFMFESYIAETPGGLPIVEITGRSVDILTANRDGIRDHDLRRQVQNLVAELATDAKNVFRKQKGLIRKRYDGTGKFVGSSSNVVKSELLQSFPSFGQAGSPVRLSTDHLTVVKSIMSRIGGARMAELEGGSEDGPMEGGLNFRMPPTLVDPVLEDTEIKGPAHIEAIVQQLSWEPDFYLINEVEDFKVPKKFFPETMSKRVVRLMRFWVEISRYIMIQLGSDKPFGVGIIFDTTRRVECRNEDGQNWLMLNPIEDFSDTSGRHYNLTNHEDINYLYAVAIHECTHLASEVSWHGDSFATAITDNFAKCMDGTRQIPKIIKALSTPRKDRGQKRGPKATGLGWELSDYEDAVEHINEWYWNGWMESDGQALPNVLDALGYDTQATIPYQTDRREVLGSITKELVRNARVELGSDLADNIRRRIERRGLFVGT